MRIEIFYLNFLVFIKQNIGHRIEVNSYFYNFILIQCSFNTIEYQLRQRIDVDVCFMLRNRTIQYIRGQACLVTFKILKNMILYKENQEKKKIHI